jgi:hypothetical protein
VTAPPSGEPVRLLYAETSLERHASGNLIRNWLSPVNPRRNTDLIFVLAGRESRKLYGLELFCQRLAPRILLSVGRFEIRSFSKLPLPAPVDLLGLASQVPPPQRHYFVEFEDGKVLAEPVRPGRFGTLTEMESLASWLTEHPKIHSVLFISSAIHLRRVKMCCQALLPVGIESVLISAQESSPEVNKRQNIPVESPIAVISELFKVAGYWVLLLLRENRRSCQR